MSVTWNSPTNGPFNWISIACDLTGQYLAAAVQNGDIWTSSDYGTIWINQTAGTSASGGLWQSITSDSTGQYLAAAVNGGDIWTSTNFGVTWTNQTTGTAASGQIWYSICSDSTGQYLTACSYCGDIWISTDSGLIWANKTIGTPATGQVWYSICSDSTGQNLAACAYYGDIWTSTNFGINWTNKTTGTLISNQAYRAISSDSTGQNLAVLIDSLGNSSANGVWTSENYGNTWLQTLPLFNSAGYGGVATNSNGQRVYAANKYHYVGQRTTICFKEDSKILCLKGNTEEYIPIQNLRKGDLVKTHTNDYIAIEIIKKTIIHNRASQNERFQDQLYVCSQDKYPEVFEDLVITGCHSILVNALDNKEQEKRCREIHGQRIKIENKYRLPACVDMRTAVYDKEGFFNIYHLALKHINPSASYGIYANGLLVESCSKKDLVRSNMTKI